MKQWMIQPKEYVNYLTQMKARVGPAATLRFHESIKLDTPSAIFKGFYDLYLEGMSVQALLIFKELMEIGSANEKRLGASHLEWAEAQTKHLIRSKNHVIRIWVRKVCKRNKSMTQMKTWKNMYFLEKMAGPYVPHHEAFAVPAITMQRPFGSEKMMLNPVCNCLSTLLSTMYCISK